MTTIIINRVTCWGAVLISGTVGCSSRSQATLVLVLRLHQGHRGIVWVGVAPHRPSYISKPITNRDYVSFIAYQSFFATTNVCIWHSINYYFLNSPIVHAKSPCATPPHSNAQLHMGGPSKTVPSQSREDVQAGAGSCPFPTTSRSCRSWDTGLRGHYQKTNGLGTDHRDKMISFILSHFYKKKSTAIKNSVTNYFIRA